MGVSVVPHAPVRLVESPAASRTGFDRARVPARPFRWALALSYARAHAVPAGAPERDHRGRPIADGVCRYPGLVDDAGLAAGAKARHCHGCERILDGKPLLP